MSEESAEQVPRLLAQLWGRAEPPRRGPRASLTLEAIAEAAISLADAEGLDALSMKRVAEGCGVSTMALYRYVDTKSDLFTLMLEFASGEPPAISRRRSWRSGLELWCRAYRDVLVAHPWMLGIPVDAPPLTPHQLGWMEAALQAMDGTGLTPAETTQVLLQLNVYVRGDTDLNARLPQDAAESVSGAWARSVLELTDPAEFPAVHAALATGEFDEDDDPLDQFEFGLARTLDGIALLVDERSGR